MDQRFLLYFIPTTFFALVGNIMIIWMKSILNKNGIRANYFDAQFGLVKFNQFIKTVKDEQLKAHYRKIMWGSILFIFLFLASTWIMLTHI